MSSVSFVLFSFSLLSTSTAVVIKAADDGAVLPVQMTPAPTSHICIACCLTAALSSGQSLSLQNGEYVLQDHRMAPAHFCSPTNHPSCLRRNGGRHFHTATCGGRVIVCGSYALAATPHDCPDDSVRQSCKHATQSSKTPGLPLTCGTFTNLGALLLYSRGWLL